MEQRTSSDVNNRQISQEMSLFFGHTVFITIYFRYILILSSCVRLIIKNPMSSFVTTSFRRNPSNLEVLCNFRDMLFLLLG
jgi:hypothetical protein